MTRFSLPAIVLVILLTAGMGVPHACADDLAVQRHMARGNMAMQMASKPADYMDAVREFAAAVKLAPDLADAWFNLGVAQEAAHQNQAAIDSFNTYLEKKPDAPDHTTVQSRIFALEYKMEKANKNEFEAFLRKEEEAKKVSRFSGTWINFNHRVGLVSGPSGCTILSSGIGESGSNSPNEVRKADSCEVVGERLRIKMHGSGGGPYPFSYSVVCEYSISDDANRLIDGRYLSGNGVSTAICDAYDFERIK